MSATHLETGRNVATRVTQFGRRQSIVIRGGGALHVLTGCNRSKPESAAPGKLDHDDSKAVANIADTALAPRAAVGETLRAFKSLTG